MRIALIKPPKFENLGQITMLPFPPLGLACIAGALEAAGHRLTIIDSIAAAPNTFYPFKPNGQFLKGHEKLVTRGISHQEILARIPHDVQMIGLHCMFTINWVADRYLIKLLRQYFPDALLVAGGEHVSAIPEICLQSSELDVVVKGEGEETIVDFVYAVENNKPWTEVAGISFKQNEKIIHNPPRQRKRKLDELPRPAWHLFPVEEYNEKNMAWSATSERSLPIIATRGCPYTCTFCSSPQMWGTRYFMRPPTDVLDEIQHLKNTYGITNFDFYDLTAIISREWILEFARLLVEEHMNITWQIPAGTRTEVIDREIAKWLYKSGCKNLVYAPESGSQRMLDAIHKKVKLPRMLTSIRQAKAEKLNVMMNMILGLPDETHTDVWRTIWFYVQCSAAGVNSIAQSIFQPYPGSALFERLVNEGKINPNDDEYFLQQVYIDTNQRMPFYNQHISPVMYRFYVWLCYAVFYGTNFIFRPWRAIKVFFNIVTKKYECRFEKNLGEYFSSLYKGIFRTADITSDTLSR